MSVGLQFLMEHFVAVLSVCYVLCAVDKFLRVFVVMPTTVCTIYRTGVDEVTSRLSGIPVFASCTFTLSVY